MDFLFLQSLDLLDGYFEIILLPFLGRWTQNLSAPGAAIYPLNLIPISCIQNLDSAIISWTMLFAYWQHSNVLTYPLLFTPNPLSMDRPSTYALPLHLFLEISWWTFFSRYSQLHLRQLGISLLPFSGWRSSSPSEEPRYTWLWKVISLQHYIPSKRVEIRRVNKLVLSFSC